MIDNNCVYPSLHNNSYADSTISGYRYGDVFVEETTKSKGIACSNYANCYIGCSCNTSNGWYSSCQGTDCKSVTDTRYTGVNAMSVSNVGDVTSLTGGVSTQSAGGNTQVVSLSGGVSTMSSSGATTCYKKKTCEEGGYYSSVPTDQKCSSKSYNGYTCYISCSYKTCTDYNSSYKSSIPSGQTCTKVTPRSGLTCYKDCKNNEYNIYAYVTDAGGCDVSDFYLKSDRSIPFDITFEIESRGTEEDDRYDPPRMISVGGTNSVTLKSGQTESSHNSHTSDVAGITNVSYCAHASWYIGNTKITSFPYVKDGQTYNLKVLEQ